MRIRVPEPTVFVQAARQQVVQESIAHLLQLGDNGFGLLDGFVNRVEDLEDYVLFVYRRTRNQKTGNIVT
jgi:hypothetical protein